MFETLQFQKNTLASKFPLRLDVEYRPFVKSKPRVQCQLCMFDGREMEDRMTRIEKNKLELILRRKGILHGSVDKRHRNCLNVYICVKCNVNICAYCFNRFHGKHV